MRGPAGRRHAALAKLARIDAGEPERTTIEEKFASKRLNQDVANYLRSVRAREEFNAQHGPVKVLIKDGKPVTD